MKDEIDRLKKMAANLRQLEAERDNLRAKETNLIANMRMGEILQGDRHPQRGPVMKRQDEVAWAIMRTRADIVDFVRKL